LTQRATDDFFVSTRRGRFRYLLAAGDDFGSYIYWCSLKRLEPFVVPLFEDYASTAVRVLDVGAHTGFSSLLACSVNPQCEVFSFEPWSPTYERLVCNIRVNRLQHRGFPHLAAVSDHRGLGRLAIPPQDTTMCSLDGNGASLDVPLIRLDDTIPLDGRTSLVKIDVEGHEERVLAGMDSIVRDSQPIIIFECNPGGPAAGIEALVPSWRYSIHHIASTTPRELDELAPGQFPHGQHNFLALPPATGDTASGSGAGPAAL
jgi:FkbM family methyltransferase